MEKKKEKTIKKLDETIKNIKQLKRLYYKIKNSRSIIFKLNNDIKYYKELKEKLERGDINPSSIFIVYNKLSCPLLV